MKDIELRDCFAIVALLGLRTNDRSYFYSSEAAAKTAYADADAMLEARKKPEEKMADGWIGWGGGECPVDKNTRVEVVLREGRIEKDYPSVFNWVLSMDWPELDIVRYRVIKD